MGKSKIKPHLRQGLLTQVAKPVVERPDEFLLISLKHFDSSQGQDFGDWQTAGLLAEAMQTLHGYSAKGLREQFNKKFKSYGGFPSADVCDFIYPKHIPEDAEWASMHTMGKPCLIGHIVGNVFYLVFLDKDHRFWITEKKHT